MFRLRHQLVAVLCLAGVASGATNPQRCERAVLLAAAKYSSCILQLRAVAATSGTTVDYTPCEDRFGTKMAAVDQKYGPGCRKSVWSARSQRFVDQGDGTVLDAATGLQWEKKRNLDNKPALDDPHDADNVYTWTAGRAGTAQDGTAFTGFLAALNGGECFAKHCDWRLPSLPELRTILLSPMPCGDPTCIDPIFGPTAASIYWSGTESTFHLVRAWYVVFASGYVKTAAKVSPNHVRAVRSGR